MRVFTTRPDTLFGATYMVLAPEHPLVDVDHDATRSAPSVDRVIATTSRSATSSIGRRTDKEKSGVFTGGYCINPVNAARIPIWIADYVLMDYGTGAIMAVPGHDERDFEFAQRFALPIVRVIAGCRRNGHDAARRRRMPATACWSIRADSTARAWPTASAPLSSGWRSAASAEAKVNYRLHDWCVSRQRYWGPPIPIIYCETHGAVPVPEADLPVILPRVEDFKPDDSGHQSARAGARVVRNDLSRSAAAPRAAKPTFRIRSSTAPGISCAIRAAIATTSRSIPALTRKWLPVHTYIGGNEHAVLHLMYARFVTMAFKDLGFIDFEEPFAKFRAHGLIINEGAKMSKSRGNVIVPDALIEKYGADTVRVYLMFLGPFEQGGDYRDQGIVGPHGFLARALAERAGSAGRRARSERREEAAPDDPSGHRADSRDCNTTRRLPR